MSKRLEDIDALFARWCLMLRILGVQPEQAMAVGRGWQDHVTYYVYCGKSIGGLGVPSNLGARKVGRGGG